MGWAVGSNAQGRDVGYGVPAICDHPNCSTKINRGLAQVCGGMHDGDEHGCGLYFCDDHRALYETDDGEVAWLCERCATKAQPFDPKPDMDAWVSHKMTDQSWQSWRKENGHE